MGEQRPALAAPAIRSHTGGTNTTRLTISSFGNVGIGTTNPQSRLHVNGTTRTNVLTITGGSDLAEAFNVRSTCEQTDVQPAAIVWVNFNHTGPQNGTQAAPYNTLPPRSQPWRTEGRSGSSAAPRTKR